MKHRGWDGKHMSYDPPFSVAQGRLIIPDGWIAMERLPLKDKRGKDIYEGDIVFLRSNPAYVIADKSKQMARFMRYQERIVTANIYENPDFHERFKHADSVNGLRFLNAKETGEVVFSDPPDHFTYLWPGEGGEA